ncbi:hypothetical protein DFH94DRAFT_847583 [Russula ochroleuca]|uniref:Uncharacterized protein n=1 Tax=Russula ochroleuca TaxID=152965 RepID=A0A9P5JYC0_9AGAM|nr:hypothetical protein DFH94DRAFT_847583 [Russula ochroleuca]
MSSPVRAFREHTKLYNKAWGNWNLGYHYSSLSDAAEMQLRRASRKLSPKPNQKRGDRLLSSEYKVGLLFLLGSQSSQFPQDKKTRNSQASYPIVFSKDPSTKRCCTAEVTHSTMSDHRLVSPPTVANRASAASAAARSITLPASIQRQRVNTVCLDIRKLPKPQQSGYVVPSELADSGSAVGCARDTMRGLKRGLDLNDSASPRVMARDVRNAQGTKSLTNKTKRTALRERRDVCPIPKEHGQLHIFILNLPVIVYLHNFAVQHGSLMPLLLEGGGGGDLHPLLLLGTPFQAQAYFLVKVTLATSPYLRTSTRRFYPPFLEMRKAAPSTGWTSYPGRLMPTTAFRARNKGCRNCRSRRRFTFLWNGLLELRIPTWRRDSEVGREKKWTVAQANIQDRTRATCRQECPEPLGPFGPLGEVKIQGRASKLGYLWSSGLWKLYIIAFYALTG